MKLKLTERFWYFEDPGLSAKATYREIFACRIRQLWRDGKTIARFAVYEVEITSPFHVESVAASGGPAGQARSNVSVIGAAAAASLVAVASGIRVDAATVFSSATSADTHPDPTAIGVLCAVTSTS